MRIISIILLFIFCSLTLEPFLAAGCRVLQKQEPVCRMKCCMAESSKTNPKKHKKTCCATEGCTPCCSYTFSFLAKLDKNKLNFSIRDEKKLIRFCDEGSFFSGCVSSCFHPPERV